MKRGRTAGAAQHSGRQAAAVQHLCDARGPAGHLEGQVGLAYPALARDQGYGALPLLQRLDVIHQLSERDVAPDQPRPVDVTAPAAPLLLPHRAQLFERLTDVVCVTGPVARLLLEHRKQEPVQFRRNALHQGGGPGGGGPQVLPGNVRGGCADERRPARYQFIQYASERI